MKILGLLYADSKSQQKRDIAKNYFKKICDKIVIFFLNSYFIV